MTGAEQRGGAPPVSPASCGTGMVRRFCLYGFLKNQQYYDYSLVLALLAMGLDYTTIGWLVGVREGASAVLEVPSGVLADRRGRRRALVLSLASYIVSFGLFGGLGLAAEGGRVAHAPLVVGLTGAMLLFAVGEAFRSGTHKAMIFAWLRHEGRSAERLEVYGTTRAWAKLGSAVSVVIACGILWASGDFLWVFFAAIVPYLVNIANIASYPACVDATRGRVEVRGGWWHTLVESLGETLRRPELRRLIAEDMAFDGFFKVAKGYLQPILLAAALPLSARLFAELDLTEAQSSVVMLGPVYVALFLLSAVASRSAPRIAPGGDGAAAGRAIWCCTAVALAGLLWALHAEHMGVAIAGFACLYTLQNLWRPILLTRLDALTDTDRAATMLSVESQARSLFALVLAPLLGFLVDRAGGEPAGLWPVAAVGLGLALLALLAPARATSQAA